MRTAAALAVTVALATPPAWAQTTVLRSTPTAYRVALGAGWDSTWTAELGATFGLRDVVGHQDLQVDVALSLPFMTLARPNLRLTAGVGAVLPVRGGFRVGLAGATGLAVSDDATGTKASWVAQVTGQPGWYAATWHIALDVAWRGAIATWMRHSDLVRDLFADRYPDGSGAEDAPAGAAYAWTAHRLRFGLLTRTPLPGRTSVHMVGGFEFTPQAQGIVANPAIGQLPLYFMLGVSHGW